MYALVYTKALQISTILDIFGLSKFYGKIGVYMVFPLFEIT